MTELPRVSTNVIFRRVGDGAVLLSMSDEVYYGLNGVGARVWELLPPASRTMDDLLDVLAREYQDVSRETIAQDVQELLADLESHGLVNS